MKFTFTAEQVSDEPEYMIRFEVEDDFNEVYVTYHVSPEDCRTLIQNLTAALGGINEALL
jgi:hypothetical protein